MPNVSYIVEGNGVHYEPYVKPKLVAYYDIQDISSPTTIFTNYDNSVKSIEVDGVLLDSVVTTYQFNSVGEHVIKYEFNNPTTVGNNAPLFVSITTIKRAVIADTFTSIGQNVFSNCSSLTSVTIGNSVTSIGEYAFAYCPSLTSVTIPDSVTSIGGNAFNQCYGLVEIYYNAQCELNTSFKGWGNNLKTVVIGDSTPSIGDNAFYYCTGLTSCTIGNGVTSIGDNAFYYCSGLTSVTIGSGVTSIGQSAFNMCSSLTSITSRIMSAPSVDSGTFGNVANGGTLYVPIGSSGYETWMNDQGNLGHYNWTKVEQ